MRCPYCHTELPDGSRVCTQCDWVRTRVSPRPGTTRDEIALWLSLIPGLGHLYKGYVLTGGVIFFIAGPALLALAFAVSPATVGLSLLVLPVFLGFVMLHAYRAKDRRAEAIVRARQIDRMQPAH